MTPAAVDQTTASWGLNIPAVRKAIAFVKRRGSVTAEELVDWDARNGRRLFEWDNTEAAADWRCHQARLFLNRFRAKFDGMRVRAFIHIQEDAENEIDTAGYYTVQAIAKHSGMREQVIADITRRIAMLGSELAMWNLSRKEQAEIFEKLRLAMDGQRSERKSA